MFKFNTNQCYLLNRMEIDINYIDTIEQTP